MSSNKVYPMGEVDQEPPSYSYSQQQPYPPPPAPATATVVMQPQVQVQNTVVVTHGVRLNASNMDFLRSVVTFFYCVLQPDVTYNTVIRPSSYLGFSIFTCLCCNGLFGLIAIAFSCKFSTTQTLACQYFLILIIC